MLSYNLLAGTMTINVLEAGIIPILCIKKKVEKFGLEKAILLRFQLKKNLLTPSHSKEK